MLLPLAVAILSLVGPVPRSKMPNLCQFGIPGVPSMACFPTAVTDGLLWLSMNGYKGLVPDGATIDQQGIAAIQQLAKYCKTDNEIGSLWENAFPGLGQYLKDHGYANSTIKFYGPFHIPKIARFTAGYEVPDLAQMKEWNTDDSFVLIALGLYSDPDSQGRCTKEGWHWGILIDADSNMASVRFNDPSDDPDHSSIVD